MLHQQDQRQEQIVGEGVAVLLRRPWIDRCPNNRRGRGRAISRETHQQHINSKTYRQHINSKHINNTSIVKHINNTSIVNISTTHQ